MCDVVHTMQSTQPKLLSLFISLCIPHHIVAPTILPRRSECSDHWRLTSTLLLWKELQFTFHPTLNIIYRPIIIALNTIHSGPLASAIRPELPYSMSCSAAPPLIFNVSTLTSMRGFGGKAEMVASNLADYETVKTVFVEAGHSYSLVKCGGRESLG